jgi:hypothetical protein
MLMAYGQELQVQLQKLRQASYVTAGKKFIVVGVFVVLHMKVTLNCNSDISGKTLYVWLHFYLFGFYLHLNKHIYPLKFVKLLLKHPVVIRCASIKVEVCY